MRKIFDFHGGIHPPENKQQSLGEPIRDAGIPAQLVVPLSQHIGAPSSPIVAVGDRVLKGQVIAEAAGFVSVPQHAPSSGTVAAIEERPIPHPSGFHALCIVIDCDGRDEWLPHRGLENYEGESPSDLLEHIREAGIAGMGGAGFPSAVKLKEKPGASIDTLIINGTECEPYITADDALMREHAAEIVAGAEILRHIVGPKNTLIGVEDNKPEGIAALQAAAEGTGIEIVVFPTKYPSGGEKQLIEILTGRQVPSGGLPADVGVVCQNVGTAVAVYDAIVHGRPLISRITTITGEAVSRPGNYRVLLGSPMQHLLDLAGFDPARNQRLVMGGPMMGFTLTDSAVPVVKTTNCLLAPSAEELPAPPPAQACIRCGLCAEACPASLLPQQLFWFARGKEYDKLEEHNLFDCIECGACSWACPSHIPLVQYYRASKADILQQRRDHEKSEQSRIRFEARQERLAREEAEKEAKRLARKKAAELRAQQQAAESGDDSGAEVDPIQAAIERAKAKKAAQQQAAGGESEQDKLEKAVASTRKRLDTASAKLEQARAEGSDLIDALQSGVDKTRAKLEAAEKALAEHLASQDNPPPASEPAVAKPRSAAEIAIAKAKAARAAEADLSPQEKARKQLDSLRQRLDKSEQRLAQSREAGEDEKIVEALAATVQRLKEKISALESEAEKVESP
ncbi:electron transport complex subunit RsxC [Parahaliea aestuarii]|uniref:Ion-translocating oxidoreductase complex subunit C n=1 Tax=Parahaliea aestuarii TaxID=1852021 RepID=A0A5C8ZNI9_9GAMM|nr:electron transport complex subunit RsxC [Parahaliea aestuarii]TXS89775.1 electron transport complex subunit RsxC [Parahaliea aestuarii]